jgi:hypothetical protein
MTPTCEHCTEPAEGWLNGHPLCVRHLREVQQEWVRREDETYAREAERLRIEIPPEVLRDREFGPVCWLLSAPLIAGRAWRYVNVERRQVEWEQLLEASKPWSPSERLFVELALNLRNGDAMFSPYAWGATLDRHNFPRLLEALALAGGRRVIVLDPPD